MSLSREQMLRELELLPVWRQRDAPAKAFVAQAPLAPRSLHSSGHLVDMPFTGAPANSHLLQGTHDRGYLPHLKAEGGIYFVTFRLADSLPASQLAQWEALPESDKSDEIERWLDTGHGACWLAQRVVADCVREVLLARQAKDYQLHAWVIMPNHVHLVIEPLTGQSLSDILQTIKSTSAHRANKLLEREGEFWQRESFDHLVRDEEDFVRCCHYVRKNPVKARLAEDDQHYIYGDAFVADAGEGACATAPHIAELTMPVYADTGSSPELEQGRSEAIQQMDWQNLQDCAASCEACVLSKTRTQTVFGVGDPNAEWLFIGEAPGAEEDRKGEPFVGPAGKLLDNMLTAIGLKRSQNVYIANVLKCRPPENRDPQGEEVAQCDPFLKRQVELIKPKLIIALGKFAAQSLLNSTSTIASMRAKQHDYHGVPVIVTYHPAYLLRNMKDKAKAWEDLCFARSTMQALQAAANAE